MSEQLELVRAALAAAWEAGNYLADPDDRDEMAKVALRRSQSYTRRHPKGRGSRAERLEDLAKGLRAKYEPARQHVDPAVTEDYRDLAGWIVDGLKSTPAAD